MLSNAGLLIVNHDCFYNADHIYEIQGILLGSDGW